MCPAHLTAETDNKLFPDTYTKIFTFISLNLFSSSLTTSLLSHAVFVRLRRCCLGASWVSTKVIFFAFDEIEIPTKFCANFVEVCFDFSEFQFDFDVKIGILNLISISIVYSCRYRNSDEISFWFRRIFDVEIGIFISVLMSKSEFRFRFRLRNSDSEFDSDIGVPTSIPGTIFQYQCRNF
jgi:hypothetical protein